VRPLAHDEPGARGADRGRLRLPLADDLLERGVGLIVLEGGRVALHVVAERVELLDELLIRELDAVLLQLLPELVDPLLGH
jgi:hypothetical protein